MVFLLMLVYPMVWSFLFIGTLLLTSVRTGTFDLSAGLGKDFPGMLLIVLGPSALIMGLLGIIHLLILYFSKKIKGKSATQTSLKIGLTIGTLLVLFWLMPNSAVPRDVMGTMKVLGLPSFFTAALSGYLIGLMSKGFAFKGREESA